ncbi:DUF2637 domain-containing protein [Streptomyces sp. 4N124]|uniref:DUF2637 domain-containing protein n=1 Tax=Streptomyces sp. 4N124 TaxID=3457420 RepID=UPI003FD68F12
MSEITESPEGAGGSRVFDLDAWIRSLCALVVAGVAAYASYVHQREFALQGGVDEVGASLWPLSVDGLVHHEALGGRAEVEGLRRRVVAAARLKLGAA